MSFDFKPKRLRPYKIPEKLKPDVDRQIQELLQLGFIQESKSTMASPMVCILKKDSSVRCVIDYRYLNGFTVPDALEPPDCLSRMGPGDDGSHPSTK